MAITQDEANRRRYEKERKLRRKRQWLLDKMSKEVNDANE